VPGGLIFLGFLILFTLYINWLSGQLVGLMDSVIWLNAVQFLFRRLALLELLLV